VWEKGGVFIPVNHRPHLTMIGGVDILGIASSKCSLKAKGHILIHFRMALRN
jgi:hypothetical protein